MAEWPLLLTERLRLRAFRQSDAEAVTALCGDREIAATTLVIPHPYALEDAQKWIARHQEAFDAGKAVDLAVTLRSSGELIGAIGLFINAEHERAELGYWIGKPFWGQGYATEAAREMVRYGFEERGLNRVFAYHFARNPASGRVLQKIPMLCEGTARQLVKKWGEYEDCPLYAVLRTDYDSARAR